jgi:hypothetical protein
MGLERKASLATVLALALAEVTPQPQATPPPGPCDDCGEPATCFGRSGMKCDKCCADWCHPMPGTIGSKS